MALIMITLRILDDCAHGYLLLKPLSWKDCITKDGKVAILVQPLTMSRPGLSEAISYTKWPMR
jgi:hypothetical protein